MVTHWPLFAWQNHVCPATCLIIVRVAGFTDNSNFFFTRKTNYYILLWNVSRLRLYGGIVCGALTPNSVLCEWLAAFLYLGKLHKPEPIQEKKPFNILPRFPESITLFGLMKK